MASVKGTAEEEVKQSAHGKEGEERPKDAESGEEEDDRPAEEGSDDSQAAKSEEEEDDDDVKGGKGGGGVSKKRGAHKKTEASSSPATPSTSTRPTRDRKTVDRFYVSSPPISAAPKSLSIEKGRGMQLKDIPNVAYKLSKRKPDENLQILHSILYGKKAKARNLKKNIGEFSGYTWPDDEHEKQKGKVRDRLDKCVKEKLLDFCDILNVASIKSSSKKEELTVRLLEFLESPHSTTDQLLAEKEKKRKSRRSRVKKTKRSTNETAEKAAKKKKSPVGKKRKQSSEISEDAESSSPGDESEEEEEDAKKESDNEGTVSDDTEQEEDKEESSMKDHDEKITPEKGSGDTDILVKPSKTSDKPTKVAAPLIDPEAHVSKKRKAEKDSEGDDKNASAAEKASSSEKKLPEKPKKGKVKKSEPNKEEIYAAVVNILKGADFEKATVNDIIRQLGSHFEVDFKPRKAEVKAIITEAITNMSGDEEEDEDQGGED
ncbi:unnamed protein product [Cuscuta europaea]|uniref:DEK-C domain-containing protein n=1 Tax=Cuscuta europaea TaxID=41803 RepID=A0A9P0YGH4_CUSEU|nr:unnamed protein product [Cuscuta europaea]